MKNFIHNATRNDATRLFEFVLAGCLSSMCLACSGGDDPAQDADTFIADANPIADSVVPMIDAALPMVDADSSTADAGSPDAFVATGPCNPVTQADCPNGQKCAQLVSSEEPFLASTSCVPNGAVTEGGACTRGAAGPAGYDDCIAGFDCLRGVCVEICTSAGGDTCRTDLEGFGEGTYCTKYANLFSDEVGLCVSACYPTVDTTANGAVINASCGLDNGCYLNVGRAVAACAGIPAGAANRTQGDDCYGPAFGSCFLNGCASGYAPILPNGVGQAATTNTCSRYCTPADTHSSALTDAAGTNGKCVDTALNDAGSSVSGTYQCRFVQTLYGVEAMPVSVGMCVPTVPWYDCTIFDWDGIMAAVTNAANPEEAFNLFCFGSTSPDPQDPINASCDGLGFGCLSQATRQQLYDLLP